MVGASPGHLVHSLPGQNLHVSWSVHNPRPSREDPQRPRGLRLEPGPESDLSDVSRDGRIALVHAGAAVVSSCDAQMSVATGSLFRLEFGPSLRCSLSLRARLCCMSEHVRAPMCTHARRGGCAHVCICASVYVCTRVCVYDCTHTSLCMCVHAHASVSPACAPVCMCLRVHACVSVCTYVRLRPLVRLQWAGAECVTREWPLPSSPVWTGPP